MKMPRIYVEKRPPHATEARLLLSEIQTFLNLPHIQSLRIVNRYDLSECSDALTTQILSDPLLDTVTETLDIHEPHLTAEYLPGQHDARREAVLEAMRILGFIDPQARWAKQYIFDENTTEADIKKLTAYLINPLERRTAEEPREQYNEPKPIKTIALPKTPEAEAQLLKTLNLVMTQADFAHVCAYFRAENRHPTETEIRILDTYWSDHCRHSTFNTHIENVRIENEIVQQAFDLYLETERQSGKNRPITLMNIALAAMRAQRAAGTLNDLEESDEVNAASIVVEADISGKPEKWLVMFKNETHNHPTEIEPMGGAGTCLGGAIRDPLSGRAYVYGAIRVTGSADPTAPYADTLPGKLPQRVITQTAAAGYAGYGNQAGVAAGHISEIYHPGFMAKRMELGFVIAACPQENVRRMKPKKGDKIILLGGRTGRDGIGGATGSSREQAADALVTAGAEVQKGDPATGRKMQRLFRRPEVSRLIKACNDFGAGGVSVAVGELADSLDIYLDRVPVKYPGLNGTELAVSESQERMAVVVDAADTETFVQYAAEEALEATVVADVTDTGYMRMYWRGERIADIARTFLNTNGAKACADVFVPAPSEKPADTENDWVANLRRLNVCSQKGLIQRFDATAGANSLLLPLGGRHRQTPSLGLAMKLPLLRGTTETATLAAYGYDPYVASLSPFHGAVHAVVASVTKAVAMGADYARLRLTFQEYFEKLGNDPAKWGKPFAAVLGAFYAQMKLGIPAVGGKDSMSGSFGDLHVPPTLVSFAVGVTGAGRVKSPEFKAPGHTVVLLRTPADAHGVPDFTQLKTQYKTVYKLNDAIASASVVGIGGAAAAISKMAFGNRIGIALNTIDGFDWFANDPTAVILAIKDKNALTDVNCVKLGETMVSPCINIHGNTMQLDDLLHIYESTLSTVFPIKTKPKVVIPIFPGTSGEYDMAYAFETNGAMTEQIVISDIKSLAGRIRNAQIIALAGGSGYGDEPDGAGRVNALILRNPFIWDAIQEMLRCDGLILGICNGFQTLIKLGFFGNAALALNPIGCTVSDMVQVKIVNNASPWLRHTTVGETHWVPGSQSEGRVVCGPGFDEKQIAATYASGGIEALTSPDGRVLGKMTHSERARPGLYQNFPEPVSDQGIFVAGVSYFV
jgi:phosphoribosylformylglycinamidine synthase